MYFIWLTILHEFPDVTDGNKLELKRMEKNLNVYIYGYWSLFMDTDYRQFLVGVYDVNES